MIGWALVTMAFWPEALTFRDEVGYVGQARLLLSGHMRPLPDSVCYAYSTPHGLIASYPFALPLVLAGLWTLSPGAVFLLGLASALFLVWESAKRMESWGRPAHLGLTVLLFPTVAVLSRTVMADTLLAALALLAWRALAGGAGLAAVAFALLVFVKPTGIPLATALIVGRVLTLTLGRSTSGGSARWSQLAGPLGGALAGACAALALNRLATGSFGYAYAYGENGFGAEFLRHSGARHLLTLALLPPGLVLGFGSLLKRREIGAALASAGLIILMGAYSFVDSGRGWLDSLALSPRLILPAAVILYLAYVDMLAGWFPKTSTSRALASVLLASMVVVPATLGRYVSRRDEPMRAAREAAEQEMAKRGGRVLGLGASAFKVGLLAREPVVWAAPGTRTPDVVLCATETESYRAAGPSKECALDGYDVINRIGTYRILVRTGDVLQIH